MSSTNLDAQPKFIRRSDQESICASCLVTVHSDPYTKLEDAEEIHSDVCLVRADSAVRYAML